MPGVLRPDQVERAKAALKDRWRTTGADEWGKERIYGLLELDPVFGEFLDAIPGRVRQLMKSVMGPWIVGAFDVYKFDPVRRPWNVVLKRNLKAGSLHSDFPYGHATHHWGGDLEEVPQQYPLTVQLIFMVDAFTERNGGTVLLPGSYKQRRLPMTHKDKLDAENQTRPALGQAGDLVVYIGQTWHGNDLNLASTARIGVIAQCLPWFFKPMQSFMYTLPHGVAQRLSPFARHHLGLRGYHFHYHTSTMGVAMWPQRLRYIATFVSDALYHGYKAPASRARSWALTALCMPLAWLLGGRGREAAQLLLALGAGIFLGADVTLEKLHM